MKDEVGYTIEYNRIYHMVIFLWEDWAGVDRQLSSFGTNYSPLTDTYYSTF